MQSSLEAMMYAVHVMCTGLIQTSIALNLRKKISVDPALMIKFSFCGMRFKGALETVHLRAREFKRGLNEIYALN